MPHRQHKPHPEHHEHQIDPAAEEALTICRELWVQLERELGADRLQFPSEIIWLNGAPGSGKGTNTPFIMRERDITAPPIVCSDLLQTPEFKKIKDSGNLISDRDVVHLLFRKLLEPQYGDGVLVDGFPRTRVQAECLKQLHNKMLDLRRQHSHHPEAAEFPKPVFRIAVLWVEEAESVARQLSRGRHIIAHNQRVRETGTGKLLEERATDTNEEAVKKRYRIFKEQTLESLTGLRNHFHYHLINATGDIASVERAIITEFQYQSSLELDDDTLDAINHIPLASTMVHGARQHLVRRLDNYEREHRALFREVVAFLEKEAMPAIHLHAITGLAISMAVDILSERGYFAMVLTEHAYVPVRFDLKTGAIESERRLRFRFQIRFQGSVIRRGH